MILYSEKLSFKNKGETDIFSNKQELRELINSRPAKTHAKGSSSC